MIKNAVNAIIYYQHTHRETAELAAAIVPLHENIRAVGSQSERSRMRNILHGETFRYQDARAVVKMLIKACKHARTTLHEYFPELHPEIIASIENLENATRRYWEMFQSQIEVAVPTH